MVCSHSVGELPYGPAVPLELLTGKENRKLTSTQNLYGNVRRRMVLSSQSVSNPVSIKSRMEANVVFPCRGELGRRDILHSTVWVDLEGVVRDRSQTQEVTYCDCVSRELQSMRIHRGRRSSAGVQGGEQGWPSLFWGFLS